MPPFLLPNPGIKCPLALPRTPKTSDQRPTIHTARGDDDSSIASDSSHAQQEKGSVTTPVHGQPASPTGTGGLAMQTLKSSLLAIQEPEDPSN